MGLEVDGLTTDQLHAEGARQRDRLVRGVVAHATRPLTSHEIQDALVGWPITVGQVRESCRRLGFIARRNDSGADVWGMK